MRTTLRTTAVAVRAMVVFTLLLGVAYMLLITAVGQVALPFQANGSLIKTADGTGFGLAADRAVLHGCRWQRPPAVLPVPPLGRGRRLRLDRVERIELGPENEDLIAAIEERKAASVELDGSGQIPADALTASASGLDPDISVATPSDRSPASPRPGASRHPRSNPRQRAHDPARPGVPRRPARERGRTQSRARRPLRDENQGHASVTRRRASRAAAAPCVRASGR